MPTTTPEATTTPVILATTTPRSTTTTTETTTNQIDNEYDYETSEYPLIGKSPLKYHFKLKKIQFKFRNDTVNNDFNYDNNDYDEDDYHNVNDYYN